LFAHGLEDRELGAEGCELGAEGCELGADASGDLGAYEFLKSIAVALLFCAALMSR
jgi:hypothetical protein